MSDVGGAGNGTCTPQVSALETLEERERPKGRSLALEPSLSASARRTSKLADHGDSISTHQNYNISKIREDILKKNRMLASSMFLR